jgi:hypothetical protein
MTVEQLEAVGEDRAEVYGTGFPDRLMEVCRGMHSGDWEFYWALVVMARHGNWIHRPAIEIGRAFGLTRTATYSRMRKLKDKGLILGTQRGYLLNGAFFFKGRLHQLRAHLDEYAELSHAEERRRTHGGGQAPPGEADEAGTPA